MTWHILLADKDGNKYTSSPLYSREEALNFASDLLRSGDFKILKVEDTHGESADLEEAHLWCEAARQRMSGRSLGLKRR